MSAPSPPRRASVDCRRLGVACHDDAVQRTVAVLNQKGGVGKTTVTLGLASAARQAGRRVLIVDLDPQASATWVLGIEPDEVAASTADAIATKGVDAEPMVMATTWGDAVDLLPASGALQALEIGKAKRLRRSLSSLESSYDAVLVDCPPSLGNLTRNALTAARHALIVVEPSALGLRGIGGVADLVDEVWDASNPQLELAGVVVNRVPSLSREAERRLDELGRIVGRSTVWRPPVPQRVILNQALGERRPIHEYASRATDPIVAFDALWRRLRGAIGRM